MSVYLKCVFGAVLLAASNTATAQSNAAERWFEIELIVFSPARSADLKEQFDNDVTPIRLSNSFDLVTAHYQPQINTLLGTLVRCAETEQISDPLLPAKLRDWQQWQPVYYPLFCLSEQQPAAWQRTSLFPEILLNNELPMPASLPVQLAGKSDNHMPVPYLAPRSAFGLTELAAKINRQPNQTVLLHTVWRQAPVTEKLAVPSRWFAGADYSELVDYWGRDRQQAANDDSSTGLTLVESPRQDDLFSAIDTLLDQLNAAGKLEALPDQPQVLRISDSLSNLPDNVWQLDGLFKLHLDHYLFVNTDFNLRRFAADGMQSINVKQSRRVISGELHYLDHPYLGMIIQIRRFQPPEPETVEEIDVGEVTALQQ
ncbi:CsiV family protein [Arsukibacterium indicum]|uniref:Peptidoglycan binding protein CsiV n=1 Tax=Arsukibacterium indicum TaxID=2848612 RepID=A0ABS6MJ93_9GAMM|nr:CsiV family protein [Arsukibacterium indicum]MBV2128434.1 peptidoglycan binding protein CsiV [Arsukibacterium indicum]